MATATTILNACYIELGQVGSIGVQTYLTERLLGYLNRTFRDVYLHGEWPQFSKSIIKTLDGTTGKITGTLNTEIKAIENIYSIFYNQDTKPLSLLPTNENPNSVFADAQRFFQWIIYSEPTKIFKVYPSSLTGDVTINYRQHFERFIISDEIPFNEELMIYGTCAKFLQVDGSNPTAKSAFEQNYNSLLTKLFKDANNATIDLRRNNYNTSMQRWT